jgi:acetyl esterase/lipase
MEVAVGRLDVYVPERKGAKPVVVFVHGGVWSSGDKWQFSPLGSFLAEEGVVAVLVQYTLYPKVRHSFSPSQLVGRYPVL